MQGRKHQTLLTTLSVAVLLGLFLCFPTRAQEGDRVTQKFLNNVIQLTVTFSRGDPKYGFGFVAGEQGRVLYVVTANHVVRKDDPDVTTEQVRARFYTDPGSSSPIELLEVSYPNLDLALLKLPKPFEGYTWESKYFYPYPKRGDQVWFIGRNQEWWVPTDNIAGVIREAPFHGELPVSIYGVQPGTSGAPLIAEKGIVGMIIEDEEGDVTALDIGTIQQVVTNKWRYPWGLEEFQSASNASDSEVSLRLDPELSRHVWISKGGGTSFLDIKFDPYRVGVSHREDMPPAGESRVIFSFDLTSIRGKQLQTAVLDLTPSNVIGDPFRDFQALMVEEVSVSDISQVLNTSARRILARVTSLPQTPIEVTDAVKEAIQRGARNFQVRLTFSGIYLPSVDSELKANDSYIEWDIGTKLIVTSRFTIPPVRL